ncbi:hypothetical protein [Acinetobacter sp.]|uniref:hypothetical protein n=1 Tax=Acinetobacter sp. TaxID=472 RepID=UPI0038907249
MIVAKILPYVLIAASVATLAFAAPKRLTPAQPIPKAWDIIMDTPEIEVGLDPASLKVAARNQGFEVSSNFRINFHQPINVGGKKEKDSYYVNHMTTVCNTGEMHVDSSDVYTADGTLVATGKNLGVLHDPKDPKSFITQWVFLVCKDLKDKRPPPEA